jgi:hypothetical protein
VAHLVAGGAAAAPGAISGPAARICGECLELCLEILVEPSSP